MRAPKTKGKKISGNSQKVSVLEYLLHIKSLYTDFFFEREFRVSTEAIWDIEVLNTLVYHDLH
jgi:hypothetical protein